MRTILRLRENPPGTIEVDLLDGVIQENFDELPPVGLGLGPDHQDLISFRDQVDGGGKTSVVGEALFQALAKHKKISGQLDASIAQQAPIYVCDPSLLGQALPWEALRSNGSFLALDTDQRLARMVRVSAPAGGAVRAFDGELRILALLAAAGGDANHPDDEPLTAEAEWQALVAALAGQPADLRLRIRVLGCDDAVRDAIAALGDPRFSFDFLPKQSEALDRLLGEAEELQPHVIHFFCHGQAGDPPQLELATREDQLHGNQRGSVLLEPNDFDQFLERAPGIWLATLNCCLGATPTDKSHGLARELVRSGFPAVIGMREAIDRKDAHDFCAAFYAVLCSRLRQTLAGPQPARIDWPRLLVEPRRKLCRAHVPALSQADRTKVWTLPVLYVGAAEFELQVAAPAVGPSPALITEAQAELATLTSLRAELAATGAPLSVLAGIDQRIAQLRQRLSIP